MVNYMVSLWCLIIDHFIILIIESNNVVHEDKSVKSIILI